MVVERLTFSVDPADHGAWIAADKASWSPFLARQKGFVSKQLWVQRDRPGEIQAVIIWQDEAAWKAIPEAELRATDALMGNMVRPLVCHVFDIVDDTQKIAV